MIKPQSKKLFIDQLNEFKIQLVSFQLNKSTSKKLTQICKATKRKNHFSKMLEKSSQKQISQQFENHNEFLNINSSQIIKNTMKQKLGKQSYNSI